MANEIQDAFNSVYADGPAGSPAQPPKPDIRNIVGATIQAQIDTIRSIATSGARPKSPVLVAAVGNVDIATGLQNGTSISGVTVATGDSVLLTAQSSPAQNGVYTVVASGAASRRTDMDESADFPGASFFVSSGNRQGSTYICVPFATPVVVGTTPLDFVLVGAVATDDVAQTIGVSGTPIDGSPTSSNQTVVLGSQVQSDGYLSAFRIFGVEASEIRIRRFTKSGDVFTAVGGDLSLSIAAGVNLFTRDGGELPFFEVKAGQYLGVYARKSAYTYTNNASIGWWGPSPVANSIAFTDSALTTNLRLELGLDLEQSQAALQAQKSETIDSVLDRGTQFIGLGKDVEPGASTSVVSANTVAFRNPAIASGVVSKIRASVFSAGTFLVRRFSKSGDTFTQVGPDYPVIFTDVGIVTLEQSDLPYIPLMKGEYIGFYRGSAQICYLSSTDGVDHYADPFYSAPTPTNVSTFDDATENASLPLQIGFEVTLNDIARIDVRIDALERSVAATESAQYFADTITSASGVTAGLTVSVEAVLNREGADISVSGELSLALPTSTFYRYDLVYLDLLTLTFGAVQGTERTTDPTAFVPAPSGSEQLPVYLARVTSDSVVTLTPLWEQLNGVNRTIANGVDLWQQRARQLLPKTMAKIRRGEVLRIVGFGDSITAIQAEPPSASTPNGEYRDRAMASGTTSQYLRGKYGSDVVDALPTFTSVQLGRGDDGAGSVHSKVGWNWELVNALEGMGYVLGTDLFYDNFGIGGNSSGDAVSGGVPTTWLSSAVASDADLAIVALGMNERGSTFSSARLIVIAEAFKAVGTEVIFLDVPRPRSGTFSDWQYTNRVIRQVAEYTKSAHVSFTAIADDRYLGSLGVDVLDVCQANGNNHPGLTELEAYGRMLSRVFVN